MKRVVVAVVVLAVGLSAAIAWKIRAQQESEAGPPTGSGVIEGEGVDLSSRIGARVIEVHAHEGDTVEAGAVLLTLNCDEPRLRMVEAEARLAATQAQAASASALAEAAVRQTSAARAAAQAAGAQASALESQRDVATRQAERLESMGEHASTSRRDQARSTAAGLEAQARAARGSRSAQRRQASAARSQASAAASQAEAAARSVEAIDSVVQAARLAVEECRIVAPQAGVVERLYYEEGELVMPGARVARLVDRAFVRATFYIPNRDVDEASVGQPVSLAADAYPERAFEGVVHRVGLEAEFTPRNVQTRSDRDRLVYPVEVRLANPDGALRVGMPVQVTLDPAS
ncbi:MAG: HlyD family secretion protein [Sandaracinaceae bacterium]